jgi:2-polyprenyl-3-methyl-5-hydroxy-6-metoxy-1,4-benzoquinol methylase
MKRQTFDLVFREIARCQAPGRLLDVGCAFGTSLQVAESWEWDGYGLELNPHALALAREKLGSRVMCGDFESVELQEQSYDTILMFDVLEHLPDPSRALAKVNRTLRPSGLVVINTPCTQSLSAKLMRRIWFHLKAEHLFLFSQKNLMLLLEQHGFQCLLMRPSVKALHLLYVDHILQRYRVPWLSALVHLMTSVVPRDLTYLNFYTWSGDMFVIAKKL